jgi:sulfur carrier protein ThiS
VKVKVKLYGTLGQNIPGYRHSQGIEVVIPDGATVQDLFTHLEIPESLGAVAIVEGRILNVDDVLMEDVPVNILQAMRGGRHNQFF